MGARCGEWGRLREPEAPESVLVVGAEQPGALLPAAEAGEFDHLA
ncbi:hypothetical protein [Kitasatospora sp. NPDC057500]